MPSESWGTGQSESEPQAGRDRRANQRILAHWNSARCHQDVPSLSDLELGQHADVYALRFLLREDRNPCSSVYILCGETAQLAYEQNPIGTTLSEAVPEAIKDSICDACTLAVREERPVADQGSYLLDSGEEVRYRSIFTPALANGGSNGGYVFGTFGHKVFATPEVAHS